MKKKFTSNIRMTRELYGEFDDTVWGELFKQAFGKGATNRGDRQQTNAANVLRYVLKAASEETGASLGLTRSGTGGRIIGKRCGWTQNIGPAERRKTALCAIHADL